MDFKVNILFEQTFELPKQRLMNREITLFKIKDQTMKKVALIIFILSNLTVFAQNNKSYELDSLLHSIGLPSKYFTIMTYQAAKNSYYDSKPYDFSMKPDDTIILLKSDTIEDQIILKNITFPFKLDLSSRCFNELVDFSFCVFEKDVYIADSRFCNSLVISHSKFDSCVFIHNAVFKESVNFENLTFNLIELSESVFEKYFTFNENINRNESFIVDVKFNNGCAFNHSVFEGNTWFTGSTFAQRPTFWETKFNDSTYFSHVNLLHGIDFQSARFKYLLGLNSLVANGKIYFDNVYLPEYIDLSYLISENIVDFNFINDSLKNYRFGVNLYKADLSKIILTDRFYLWFDNDLSIEQRNIVYKQLLFNLSNKGYKTLYKTIDLQYREFENKNYNGVLKRLASYVNKIWWNYGYDKERIFLISIILIIVFSINIFLKLDHYVNVVYKIDSLSKKLKSNNQIESKLEKLIANYGVALLYTIFLFFNLKLSLDKISFEKYRYGLFILLIFSIGLICTAFIVNLVVAI